MYSTGHCRIYDQSTGLVTIEDPAVAVPKACPQ